VYAIAKNPDMPAIAHAVKIMEKRIQEYVPGYNVTFLILELPHWFWVCSYSLLFNFFSLEY